MVAVSEQLARVSSRPGSGRGSGRGPGRTRSPRSSMDFVQRSGLRGGRFGRRVSESRLATHYFKLGERTSFDAVAFCGRALGGEVRILSDGESAWPSGVAACGRVWLCPVCAPKIKARRAVELESACDAHAALGGSFSMVTVTARHDRSMALVDVRRAVASSWRKVQRRKSWRDIRALLDGQVTAPEVTVGANGWHPHAHVLLFVRAGVSRSDLDKLLPDFIDDWRELVNSSLDSMPSVERAVNLVHFGSDSRAAAAGYLSKVANELTASDMKSGRDPFSLLDGVGEGDAESIARWIEYADAMKGVQSISWSKGLRARLGLGVELTDEEVALQDEAAGVVVGVVFGERWNSLLRRGVAHELLEEFEAQVRVFGLDAVASLVT